MAVRITPEMLQEMMNGADIGGMEDEQTNQLALANSLRKAAPPSAARNDWGSNLGRAAYGVAGAIDDRNAMKMGPTITEKRKGYLTRMAEAARRSRMTQQTPSGEGGAFDEKPLVREEEE